MIKYFEGTVFNVDVDAIVNTVNTEGFMGAGLALEMSLRYPDMYVDYKEKCNKKIINIGKVDYYQNDDLIIVNFPTKKQFKYPSKLLWIEEGLKNFCETYNGYNIKSIAFPKMGTLNGKLNWEHVKILMEKYLSNLNIEIIICLDNIKEPMGKELQMVQTFNSCDIERLTKFVKLTKKQKEILQDVRPIKRFFQIRNVDGIGNTTYANLFDTFYNNKYFEEINLFNFK